MDGHKKQKPRYVTGHIDGQSISEMLYDAEEGQTCFAQWDKEEMSWKKLARITSSNGRAYLPYQASNTLVARGIVQFPSAPDSYSSNQELFNSIRAYIHRYVDVSERFEKIASYYIMLTWVYDAFNELPYLRLRGDYGVGKTRFLLIAGSLCYKPFLSSGASTVAPIFHMLNAVGGTLVLDEADLRFSDEKTDMVKILNNGTVRDVPVLRCEKVKNGEFRPTAYNVFGPKIVATRGYFSDDALESRFISEDMGGTMVRAEIPRILPHTYRQEALRLRNQLLMYRFKNLDRIATNTPKPERSLSGRLNQMFLPLLSVVEDRKDQEAILSLARKYHRQHRQDRAETAAARVCALISHHQQVNSSNLLTIKALQEQFIRDYGQDYDRRITAKWIGFIIRKKLLFETIRSAGNYHVVIDQSRLKNLCDFYGITSDIKS